MRSLTGLAALVVVIGLAAGCGSTAPSSAPSSRAPKPAPTAPSARTFPPASPALVPPSSAWPTTLTQPYRVVIDVAHASLPPFPGVWDITTWPQFWQAQVAFNEGHQPWRGNPLMVTQAWADAHMTNATVSQAGPDTFKVTEPSTGRLAMITGTRPVTVGLAQLWVITKISS
jgi:hypothetical protein